MIKLFCFSVLYLQISVISSRLISRQIQYKGTDKKPADLTIIEVLSDTSEVATCLLYCSKKTDCKSVVYEDTKCYLYSTSVGSLPLASGQKAIAEFSTDISTNLCTEPGTYCKHSSVFMTFTCACATDGFLDANPCTDWASLQKNGAWIKVTFPRPAIVEKMEVWHRCSFYDQYKQFIFTFSDTSKILRSIQCSENRDPRVCPEPRPFSEIILSPPKLTNWVMLTGYKSCHPTTGRNGFKELKYIGRFI